MNAVSDRWSLHVVKALAFGAYRYTDILKATGAPRDVLASRLKKLAEAGIISAQSKSEGADRAGYELTQKGRDLSEVLLVLKKWGDLYGAEDTAALTFTHKTCGSPFTAQIRCKACGEPVHRGELQTE